MKLYELAGMIAIAVGFVYSMLLERKVKSMEQGLRDIGKEMEWECRYIEDIQLRERILNILRVMILKHFK